MKTVKLPKNLDRYWVEHQGQGILSQNSPTLLECADLENFDTAAKAFFCLATKNRNIKISELSPELAKTINSDIAANAAAQAENLQNMRKKSGFFEGVGDAVINSYDELCKALVVLVEMIYWGTVGVLHKQDFRKGVLGEQMYHLGYGALGITVVLTFLIGVAISAQSAIQLRQFGADVFLVMLVVIGMIREIGPLMAAIILAGRTGSATTAEIATMKVQEEIDALKTMGLNEIQFIVVPKFWAMSITMPLLSIMATLAGIFGGFCVAYFYSGLSPQIIMSEFVKNIIVRDLVISLIKSLVFSWLILWIGAYYGFGVRGGAEEVGKATTKSVVTAIFVIVIATALFSFVY